MGFFYGVIAVLFVIFLLAYTRIKKPLFGNILIAVTVLLITLSTVLYFQKDKRLEKKEHLIPIDQIVLSQINSALSYGNNYKLTAKVENHSKHYRLQSVNIQITFLKCNTETAQEETCQLLGKEHYAIKTRLAAEQSTHIEKYIMLNNIPELKGTEVLRWKIEILSGVAR